MAKQKLSGLGRGLGDLLNDNAPEVKKTTTNVVVRTDSGDKPMRSGSDLFEKDKKPKNKSVLANYR